MIKLNKLNKRARCWVLVPLAGMLGACGGGGSGGDDPPDPVQDTAALNTEIRALPSWVTPRVTNTDDRTLGAGDTTAGGKTYTCSVTDPIRLDPATTEYSDIMLAGQDGDALYPGALLQGKAVAEGRFDLVRLGRSPITLTTTMNIAEPSITVANPGTATMREAVATLMRRGDSRTGAIDVTPGTLLFRQVQAYSFAQSLNEVGVSMAYSGKVGSLSSDVNYGSGRTANSHSVMVTLVQPLFKVSFSEDAIASPANLLADSVTPADIETERAAGRLADDNLPVYVKSVTYGRVMMYTLTSSQVSSYSELAAAVEGSYKGFSGSGSYTDQQRSIVANSQKTLVSFGGPQEAAVSAIENLGDYFVPMQPTQAVPISYELRDMAGQVAKVGDITEYRRRDCVEKAPEFSWDLYAATVDDAMQIKVNGVLHVDSGADGVAYPLDNYLNNGQRNALEVVLYNNGTTYGQLKFWVRRNGSDATSINYCVDSPICFGGCWYVWKFTLDDATGAVTKDSDPGASPRACTS